MTLRAHDLPALHPPDDVRQHVVVLAGGEPPRLPLPLPLGRIDRVIAADAGAELAPRLGLDIDLLVGDLDSISRATRARLEAQGISVDVHPRDKDRTDLALALDTAARSDGSVRCTVLGGGGGRLDHLAGNLTLLGAPDYAALELTALIGPAMVHVIRRRGSIATAPGEQLSLLAMHGDASGVVLAGVRWPLRDETLRVGSSRGISNVALAGQVEIQVGRGVVLLVRPDPRELVDQAGQ